jgi:hypothetical protein
LSRPSPFQPAEPEPLLDGEVVRDLRSAGIGLLVGRMKAPTKRRLDESGARRPKGMRHEVRDRCRVGVPMNRDSVLLLGLGLIAAVLAGFVAFWILIEVWAAFGFLAIAAILLAFGWLYDRRAKRARADLTRG